MDGGTCLDPKAQRVKRKDEIDSDSDDDDDVTQAYSFFSHPCGSPGARWLPARRQSAPSQVRCWLPARCVGSQPGALLAPFQVLFLSLPLFRSISSFIHALTHRSTTSISSILLRAVMCLSLIHI